jgi:hypothetical protein
MLRFAAQMVIVVSPLLRKISQRSSDRDGGAMRFEVAQQTHAQFPLASMIRHLDILVPVPGVQTYSGAFFASRRALLAFARRVNPYV